MIVCESWSFKDLVSNIERLKKEYLFYLAFFSYYYESPKKYYSYIKDIRDKFYKLSIKEWQKDMCWEYMNDYRIFQELVCVCDKLDKKTK